MTSSAEFLARLVLAPMVCAAPAGLADAPASWNAPVAARVAETWRVPAEAVTLQWGRGPAAWPAAGTPFELAGRGADGWFVAVFAPEGGSATAVQVRAGLPETVWVATRPLASGEHLSDADVRPELRVRWGAPAARREARPAAGAEVRRPIATGSVVGWPAAVAPAMVVAGTPVRMAWTRGAVTVSVTGVALNSARRGDPVRARIDGRTTRLTGTAVGPATAMLGPGGER